MSSRHSPNSEYGRRFPGLVTLARDFVNHSWDFEYESAEDAVLAFLSTFPDEALSAAEGLDALLVECPDEASRLRSLDELRWNYAPRAGQLDAFLVWASGTLRAASSTTAAG